MARPRNQGKSPLATDPRIIASNMAANYTKANEQFKDQSRGQNMCHSKKTHKLIAFNNGQGYPNFIYKLWLIYTRVRFRSRLVHSYKKKNNYIL